MKKLLKCLINENGQSTVLVALILTALLGFTALAVDAGNAYLEKSEMQKALDAGVLAGAQELIEELMKGNSGTASEAYAKTMVKEISNKNGFPLEISGNIFNVKVDASSSDYFVYAEIGKKVDTYFASFIGFENIEVSAKAKAIIVNGGLVPVAVANEAIRTDGTPITIVDDTNVTPGNVGFIDLDPIKAKPPKDEDKDKDKEKSEDTGGGAVDLKDRIENGYDKTVFVSDPAVKGDGINTEPGKTNGAYQAFADRIAYDNEFNKVSCGDPAKPDYTCRRIVYVPIIYSWTVEDKDEDEDPLTGRKEVDVIDFAVFYLDVVKNEHGKMEITGVFIKRVSQHEFGKLYSAKLVE